MAKRIGTEISIAIGDVVKIGDLSYPNLEILDLKGTRITDAGFAHLRAQPALTNCRTMWAPMYPAPPTTSMFLLLNDIDELV